MFPETSICFLLIKLKGFCDMSLEDKLSIKLNKNDNVATAFSEILSGQITHDVKAENVIPKGHKIALKQINKGEKILLDPKEYPFLWPLWHIIVMFLLGYLSPKYWYLYLSLSIAWEITEYFLDKWGIGYLIFGKKAMKGDFRAYNPHDYLWNSLGLLAGVYASKHSRINLMKDIKGLIKLQTK